MGSKNLRLCFVVAIMACLLVGCGEKKEEKVTVEVIEEQSPQGEPVSETVDVQFAFKDITRFEFLFTSGAGAWFTKLTIEEDGAFKGAYADSDGGSVQSAYPNGTRQECRFTGTLSKPVKVDDYIYSVRVDGLELEQEPGTEEIKDGIKIVYSEPYGLENAEELLFYLPGMPAEELPEDYKGWISGYGDPIEGELPFYGLYNVNEKKGFSSHAKLTIHDELKLIAQEAVVLENKLQTEILTQSELTETTAQLYQLWDNKLNAMWAQLKEGMDAKEMQDLTVEQLDWIAYKENEVQKAGAEYEGGTMQPMIELGQAADMTKTRVYELAEYVRNIE